MLRVIQQACAAPAAPDFCQDVGQFLQGDPAILAPLAALLMGGYDVGVDDEGNLDADCGLACNAISVCFQLTSVPINVVGLSD